MTDQPQVLTVSELQSRVRDYLEQDFGRVWVEGEISGYKRHHSGHLYFALRDADARLDAVMWRSTARRLRFEPEEGLAVRARGHLTVYPPQGRYQMVVQALEPVGAGPLQVRFEQLRRQLAEEGLFDPEHKKELPLFPRRVALITSPTGAAVRDLISVALRRWPALQLVVVPVRVQGEGAAEEIAEGLRRADGRGFDVLVVGRGGGSLEDLWAFNEEVVARAIFAAETPVTNHCSHSSSTPAINQYKLVTRLTRGWGEYNEMNPEAPRTLFIVGDGMQSIYGFRDANVGLFLQAREQGFNGVRPTSLALRCNFRSDRGIVEWVNEAFGRAFPAEDDVRRGQVSFTAAVAVRPAVHLPAVELHGFTGDAAIEQEAGRLVALIREGLEDASVGSIAILGRSRSQLSPVLQKLRAEGIAYAAQEMDPLAGSPAIVDLMSLCRVLSNPADRVAWFALLRAPWCGLPLADLHALAGLGDHPGQTNMWRMLDSPAVIQNLSEDGARRLTHVATVMAWARDKRDRLALRVWVEQIWMRLGGPGTLDLDSRLRDAERFFELLQEAELEGVGLETAWLDARLACLRKPNHGLGLVCPAPRFLRWAHRLWE